MLSVTGAPREAGSEWAAAAPDAIAAAVTTPETVIGAGRDRVYVRYCSRCWQVYVGLEMASRRLELESEEN